MIMCPSRGFARAVAMYRHAMRIDERHYNAWYGLGAIYYRQEKYELAEYHFDRALAQNPTSPQRTVSSQTRSRSLA